MISINNKKYQKEIKEETNLWNRAAETELKKFPPDYKYYKETLPYKIYRHKYVMKILSNIKSGDKVLELGCYNGWFSLEMARLGAIVDAHDISSTAIKIAKKYFLKCQKWGRISGKITYYVTDLNYFRLPKENYDVIVIRNVLHHLINLKALFRQLNCCLKPGGKIFVDDALPCGRLEALITGGFLFILPTDIPYSQKFKRVFKKGQILKRTQGLVNACGASPFEGASGKESIIYLNKNFHQNEFSSFSAFSGSIAAHLNLDNLLKKIVLKVLNFLDIFLIKIKFINGTNYYLEATKK